MQNRKRFFQRVKMYQTTELGPSIQFEFSWLTALLLISTLINHFHHTQYQKSSGGTSYFPGSLLNCFQLQEKGKDFIGSYSTPLEAKIHPSILLFKLWLLAKCPNEEFNANTQRTQYNLCITVTLLQIFFIKNYFYSLSTKKL